jgi:hypothetical protein
MGGDEMKEVIKRTAKALVIWLIQGIIGAVFVIGGAVLLVEWASGCGETYVDSKGKRHANECVFLPSHNNTKGDKTSPNT